ncbi:MAG: polysaccharide deacetylase [Lachnospiraceae bacterium]|nr:polysaccharide deacetylase [Lachnospiraceae bacterium]
MADRVSVTDPKRRKRINRLKKIILGTVAFLIITPCVISLVVTAILFREKNINKALRAENKALSEKATLFQSKLEELSLTPSTDKEFAGISGDTIDTKISESPVSYIEEPEAKHKVYLTFDDGPSIYTEEILDILDEYGVKATFFVQGKEDENSVKRLKDIAAGGHTIGMHSYSHKYSEIYSSLDDFAQDFALIRSYIYDNCGVQSVFYRFPGGSSNNVSDIDMHVFADYLAGQDVVFFDWNVSSGDAGKQKLSKDAIVRNSLLGIEDRQENVILFHDSSSKHSTVLALPEIIESIQAMDDTVILPITAATKPVQHIK